MIRTLHDFDAREVAPVSASGITLITGSVDILTSGVAVPGLLH